MGEHPAPSQFGMRLPREFRFNPTPAVTTAAWNAPRLPGSRETMTQPTLPIAGPVTDDTGHDVAEVRFNAAWGDYFQSFRRAKRSLPLDVGIVRLTKPDPPTKGRFP